VLYPVTLSELMRVPGLAERHAAALGATASGTAILTGPLLIGAVAGAASLRAAVLVVIPLVPGPLLLRVIADHPPRYWRKPAPGCRVGSMAGDQDRRHRAESLAAGGVEGVEHADGAGERHRDLLRDPG